MFYFLKLSTQNECRSTNMCSCVFCLFVLLTKPHLSAVLHNICVVSDCRFTTRRNLRRIKGKLTPTSRTHRSSWDWRSRRNKSAMWVQLVVLKQAKLMCTSGPLLAHWHHIGRFMCWKKWKRQQRPTCIFILKTPQQGDSLWLMTDLS